MDVPVFNMKGVEVGKLAIDTEILGGEVNPALIKQAYVRYHANLRVGSSITKNRREVSGSTKKIVKQKGTGGARHGDRKVPHFRGGSHAHHKQRTRDDFRLDMPKKMRRKANLNALLAKLIDSEVKIVDSLIMTQPRTKDFVAFLSALKVDKSTLVAVGESADAVRKSARNLEDVTLVPSHQLTAFDLLNHRYLVISKGDLQSFLSGPSAQVTKEAKTKPLGRQAAGAQAGGKSGGKKEGA